MVVTGRCSGFGLCTRLPELEATLLPFTMPSSSLPFSFPQQSRIPFVVTRLSFLQPSSIFSVNPFRSLPHIRLSLLSNLLHFVTSPALTAATSPSVLRLSALSSSLASYHWQVCILTVFQSFVFSSRSLFCHAPVGQRNWPEP